MLRYGYLVMSRVDLARMSGSGRDIIISVSVQFFIFAKPFFCGV